ncbi:unnamed protein product [Gadus morhua 'NCC']
MRRILLSLTLNHALHRGHTPHRSPAPHRGHAPHRSPAPHRGHAPHRSPAPHRGYAPHRSPATHRSPAPQRGHAPHRSPATHRGHALLRGRALQSGHVTYGWRDYLAGALRELQASVTLSYTRCVKRQAVDQWSQIWRNQVKCPILGAAVELVKGKEQTL